MYGFLVAKMHKKFEVLHFLVGPDFPLPLVAGRYDDTNDEPEFLEDRL